jgi:hypothetical protein
MEPTRPTSLAGRFPDFWLLGGASIVVWFVMALAQGFRDGSALVDLHFLQLGALFSLLSLVCNFPHFIMSYRFGYGRGGRFVLRHWFSLLLVPAALLALFAGAYLSFASSLALPPWASGIERVLGWLGVGRAGSTRVSVGALAVSCSLLLMFLTSGWPYAKQVFGCMMVYAHYDAYPLAPSQRRLIKASVFSVAIFNVFYFAVYSPGYNSGSPVPNSYLNLPLVSLGLPAASVWALGATVVALFAANVYRVGYANHRVHGRWPSANFVVPWVAFHVWWIPLIRQAEFYLLAVPFFHSLQYLPFAYRLETGTLARDGLRATKISLGVAARIALGFAAFELVPNTLDGWLAPGAEMKHWFFVLAFAVFLNVHHFFIDSVVWRFNQPEVRAALL